MQPGLSTISGKSAVPSYPFLSFASPNATFSISPINALTQMNNVAELSEAPTLTPAVPDPSFVTPQHFNRKGRKSYEHSDGDDATASTSKINSEPGCEASSDDPAGPIRRRRFSTAKIQPTRIKKVMQSDEDIGRMVASVPVAIGRAMEYFAADLLTTAEEIAKHGSSKTLSAAHMHRAVLSKPHFFFLRSVFSGYQGKIQDIALDTSGSLLGPDGNMDIHHIPALQRPLSLGEGTESLVLHSTQDPSTSFTKGLEHSVSVHASSSDSNLSPMTVDVQCNSSSSIPLTHTLITQVMSTMDCGVNDVPARVTKRSSSALSNDGLPAEPRKRGRPRKVKRDEKCLDDDWCKEVASNIAKEDKDRELMPPPALPIIISKPNGKPFA